MTRNSFCIAVLLLVAAAPLRARAADAPNADPNAGTITGTITGADGKPAAGHEVNLFSARPEPGDGGKTRQPKPIATAKIDDKGNYTLANVPAGTYRMIAGIPFKEQAVANVTVKAGGKVTINLTLKARRVY